MTCKVFRVLFCCCVEFERLEANFFVSFIYSSELVVVVVCCMDFSLRWFSRDFQDKTVFQKIKKLADTKKGKKVFSCSVSKNSRTTWKREEFFGKVFEWKLFSSPHLELELFVASLSWYFSAFNLLEIQIFVLVEFLTMLPKFFYSLFTYLGNSKLNGDDWKANKRDFLHMEIFKFSFLLTRAIEFFSISFFTSSLRISQIKY